MSLTGPNQDVPRTTFLAGGSQEKSFSCSSSFWKLPTLLGPGSLASSKPAVLVKSFSHLIPVTFILLPPSSTCKDPCDDTGLTQVIQNNLFKVQLISSLTSPSLYGVTCSQVQGLGNQDVDIFEAIILPIMIGDIIISYFPGEANEAQRGPVTCPMSHSRQAAKLGFTQLAIWSRPCILTFKLYSFHIIIVLVFNTLLRFILFYLTTSIDRRIWVRQGFWEQELPVVQTFGEWERHTVYPIPLLNGSPSPSVRSQEAWVHISALSLISVCLPASCWISEFSPLQSDDSKTRLPGSSY